ncbi:MAG TPA: helix-turn-helix transcriptional regulator [Pseudonocardia sp.]|nr:helix-turn-helix transcriptional regulator [Pseudonocardia sp.]
MLKTYMRAHGIGTHGEMAAVLGVDRTLVSKYVSGARQCHDVTQLRRLAEAMDLPPETFGLLPEPYGAAADGASPTDASSEWRLIRQTLNRNRSTLTKLAADLYWGPDRIAGTACLTLPDWMPPEPTELGAVDLSWVDNPLAPAITGADLETSPYRPPGPGDIPYTRYSQAIRALAKPTLFENRGSYRLLGLGWDGARGHMEYGYTTYFDMLDVCEVLAHELTAVWMRKERSGQKVPLGDLPFRRHLDDLFNLGRRAVLPSINTLTIRRAPEGDSIFLHRRGSGQVAIAGGQTHVIPAGVFQPSGIAPWNMAGDFDLWRSMLREYSEEMLGNPEHDGSSGEPIDYDALEPFRTLNEGRRTGKVRAWVLGVGLDPLVPAGEILTTVVIESDVFDVAFARMVATNAEGELFPSEDGAVGIAWTAANVRRLQTREPLACSAAACIALTWKYRELILGG